MQPTDVYVDLPMTQLSVAYHNEELVAEKIFPAIPVDYPTGIYYKWDKSNLRTPPDSSRTGGSKTKEVSQELTSVPYGPLTEHALKARVNKDTVNFAMAPLQPRIKATNLVTEQLLLEKELKLATKLTDATQVTQNVTLSGTAQWSDYTNSDPLPTIQGWTDTIKQNSLKMPNTLVMGYQVWSKLKNHPKLIDRIKYTSKQSLSMDDFAALLNMDPSRVMVAGSEVNQTSEGLADNLQFIWGKNVWLMYVNPTPEIDSVSAGYHLQLSTGRYIDGWYDNDRKSDYVRSTDYYDSKIVCPEAIFGGYSVIA